MGLLVDGQWHDKWYDTDSTGGEFKRSESQFRNFITADGSAGPTGKGGFMAEAGRYHLYVCLACPWAHRTLIFRALKGLQDMIDVSVVDYFMGESGWTFDQEHDDIVSDDLYGLDYLYELYIKADDNYSGRVTVPVLWDKKQETIVSNESADIIRMFNSAFDDIGAKPGDYYPSDLHANIDEINARVYSDINNGVYKSGFATKQSVYEKHVSTLFEALDWVEGLLTDNRYLTGDRLTEADWRLFTTLIRFDAVYHGHFKCNLKQLTDYPNTSGYVRELYQMPGIAKTVYMDHIKAHYYTSHPTINPNGIVPLGPMQDFSQPHKRG
ncbi:glutathione S-transferase family protein [Marinicella gelatinilytica]|uniref:glutathione S-transferase family protein n=1 Tax=Marinicella gelatinilytica TaxID=2996017 RepID=UPI002260A3E4|nr:glutathione S-transferase family protein [Marinicella gelatinilytica]MCX7545753.1 glutathione S-transferase family protein [Marinicella gelatinilytica]